VCPRIARPRALCEYLATVFPRVLHMACILAAIQGGIVGAAQDAPRPPAPRLEVLVDGAKHPELIPDRAAATMLMSSFAIARGNDGTFTPIQEQRIKDLGLNALDRARFRTELFALSERLRLQGEERALALDRARQERTPEANESFVRTAASRDDLTWESYTHLLNTLSAGGARRLSKEVDRIKRQMKSVGIKRP
jgi:hypothetical protein